ncbi:MAG: SPFH domain-containing protein [Rhodospirillaceae bacterium]|nr:SPFH domain-containing protein [Rhodospirillaceae bacterium]
MATFITIVIVVVALAILIAFLQRFYRKATRETALIRTGFGGQKVVMDGGCIVMPFLHRVEEINMRAMPLEVARSGNTSLMTEDRLRLDVEMEFNLRVLPTPQGVATAAQAVGSRSLRTEGLHELLDGRLVGAMHAVVATKTMDQLHENRGEFVHEVESLLADNLEQNGLRLESASLTRFDQASLASLDENNAFNAVGMRRLAEIISANRKQRASIEADADVSVRQTQLDSLKRKLEIEREQQEAEIAQRQTVEETRAASDAAQEAARQHARQEAERARIDAERQTRLAEIQRDLRLRQEESEALLAAETTKIDSQIALSLKRAEEFEAEAETELRRIGIVSAQEKVQREKEKLAAERDAATALLRAKRDSDISDEVTKSEVKTLLDKVQAEAKATSVKAEARRNELKAEAEGKAALAEAENAVSEQVLHTRLEQHRIDRMPAIIEQMVKPAEKIDSIRINQVTGLGAGGKSGGDDHGGGGGGGASSPFNQAVEGVLNMAVQLPAMQKLGKQLGVNLDVGGDKSAADGGPADDSPGENKAGDDR